MDQGKDPGARAFWEVGFEKETVSRVRHSKQNLQVEGRRQEGTWCLGRALAFLKVW